MDELNNNTPELSKIKKEPPFRVPDRYFDDFSARLNSRLEAESEVVPEPKKGIIRYLKPALGLAASFALIFMLVYWPLNKFLPAYLARTDAPIEQENEIDTYMPSFERIDEDSFFAIIVESATETDTIVESFNDEELLNYLSANVSDYELYLHTEN